MGAVRVAFQVDSERGTPMSLDDFLATVPIEFLTPTASGAERWTAAMRIAEMCCHYRVAWSHEHGVFVASCDEVGFVGAHSATPEGALTAIITSVADILLEHSYRRFC